MILFSQQKACPLIIRKAYPLIIRKVLFKLYNNIFNWIFYKIKACEFLTTFLYDDKFKNFNIYILPLI